mgnify:CR=1 FL=1
MTDLPTALSPRQLDAYFAFTEVSSLVRHAVEKQLREAGDLGYVQFQLLARLGDAPGGALRMTDLADGVVYSRSGLTYQAQLLELKADFGGPAGGTVVEARLVEGRGPVANVLVQQGKLKVGDFMVAGRSFGRVRDIVDDKGKRHKEVDPPIPVQVSGLDMIPDAGDPFFVVDSLKKAQQAAEQRRERDREQQLAQPKVTLSSL